MNDTYAPLEPYAVILAERDRLREANRELRRALGALVTRGAMVLTAAVAIDDLAVPGIKDWLADARAAHKRAEQVAP